MNHGKSKLTLENEKLWSKSNYMFDLLLYVRFIKKIGAVLSSTKCDTLPSLKAT